MMSKERTLENLQKRMDAVNEVRDRGYKLQYSRGNKAYFTKDGKKAGYINCSTNEIKYY